MCSSDLIAVSQFLTSMYWWVIASSGVQGVRYMTFHSGIGGLIFVGVLASTLHRYSLSGIVLSYSLSSIYAAWAIHRWRVVLKW